MAGITFLSDNQVDNAVGFTITTGSANAQFPISNLQNASPAKKFRSVGNTVVFEIDLGTTRTIDTFALVGDATGDFGVTAVSFKTSVTTDFSGSPVNTVDLSSEHNIGYKYITSVSHRYVEVTLTGTGSYAELSNIFIGERINVANNSISTDSFSYGNRDRSVFRANRYGQKFIDERNKQRFISGNIDFATKDEFETLDDMFLFHGEVKPLWIIVDPNDLAMNDSSFRLALYGYLERLPQWSASGGQHYNTRIRIDQAI